MAQISSVDYDTKRVYLHADTVTNGFNIIDAHFENKVLIQAHANSEQNRKIFLTAEGKVPKGGGAFTPRYGYINSEWRFIPYSLVSHILKLSVEIVSEDQLTDSDVFDFTGVGVNVHVVSDYTPTEIITIAMSGAFTEVELHDALDSYLNKGAYQADVSGIPAEVWSHITRTLTSNLPISEADVHAALDSYTNKADYQADPQEIATAVWSIELPLGVVALTPSAILTPSTTLTPQG